MVRFQNNYTMTKDIFVEQYMSRVCFWVFVSLLAFCLLFMCFLLWIPAIVLFAIAFIIAIVLHKSKLGIEAKYRGIIVDNENRQYVVNTVFYDNYFVYTTSNGVSEKITYSSVVRSSRRQNVIVLYVDNGYSVAIKKDSFEVGSLEGFKHFMSIKGF